MPTVTVIQPKVADETQSILRVAAYCRVSSSSDDQLNSYNSQLTYYSHKFENSETETLIDIYADEGITGTSEEKRIEFLRLIEDCRKGKIDRVYTKSISRFARNTRDCLYPSITGYHNSYLVSILFQADLVCLFVMPFSINTIRSMSAYPKHTPVLLLYYVSLMTLPCGGASVYETISW